MLGLAVFVAFVSIAIAGSSFAALPGDEISVLSAFGYAIWLGLLALAAGSLAFALGPFVGRGAAAGIAGFVTFAGFILNGYQAPVPELAPFANLTWWGWTYNHVALAGQYDWPSVALVAVVAVVLLAIGVEAFAVATSASRPHSRRRPCHARCSGLAGRSGASISHNLGAAIAWGLGVGFFGLVLGGAAQGFMEQLADSPQFVELLSTVFPNVDYASAGGFLQLLFVEFGVILAGLAAATFVGGWASDETSGRLEMVLATPLSRARWAIAGGIGMLVNVALFVALTAAGIGIGVATDRQRRGHAARRLAGPRPVRGRPGRHRARRRRRRSARGSPRRCVVVFVIVTWLVQLLGPLLGLPEFVRQLALTSHFGQPMVGVWDPVGIVASLVLRLAAWPSGHGGSPGATCRS